MNIKVFIQDKQIVFAAKPLRVSSREKKSLAVNVENKTEIGLLFDFFIQSEKYSQLVLNGQVKKTFNAFCSRFKLIEAAGGVIRNEKNQTLFIYRLKKWDLPKGKIEQNESKRIAAIRECEEECGINGLKIIKELSSSWHMYQLNGEWVLKRTYWYIMKSAFGGKFIPQKEEGITKVVWVDKKNSGKILKQTYPAVVAVIYESRQTE